MYFYDECGLWVDILNVFVGVFWRCCLCCYCDGVDLIVIEDYRYVCGVIGNEMVNFLIVGDGMVCD